MSEQPQGTMSREELFSTLEQMATGIAKACKEESEGRRIDTARVGTVLLAMKVMAKASEDAWLYGRTPAYDSADGARSPNRQNAR